MRSLSATGQAATATLTSAGRAAQSPLRAPDRLWQVEPLLFFASGEGTKCDHRISHRSRAGNSRPPGSFQQARPEPDPGRPPRQLGHQPTVETRNRKRLAANLIAPWELRVGNYRIYFEVQEEPERVVRIVAIGLKVREKVLIGGVEVKLR